jgi:dihydropteroate synthase
MGVLNVTPDSFSDGGRFLEPPAAVEHARAMVGAGADVIDVGGESTRPGAEPVTESEELLRVVPVIEALAGVGVPISIDTTKARVAAAALDAGATIVNDVSAGQFEPELLEIVADRGAGIVLMHMRGEPRTMQDAPAYDDVVGEVVAFLVGRLGAATAAGIAPGACSADPGIGFGKTVEHNLVLLARLRDLVERVDAPLLVGASRKRFLAAIVGETTGGPGEAGPGDRDDATLATTVWALDQGARIIRVHDVRSTARAVTLFGAMRGADAA